MATNLIPWLSICMYTVHLVKTLIRCFNLKPHPTNRKVQKQRIRTISLSDSEEGEGNEGIQGLLSPELIV